LGLIADACLKSGRHAQALEILRDARSTLDDPNSDHFYAAEIYRLTGEAYLRSGEQLDAAEHWLLKGLALAREQNSKALELRIGVSMHDLCKRDLRNGGFHSQLAEAYRFFTEGFDTIDLLAARARLQA
jgi:tetratricopeptide (TPR) repeat protein